MALLGAIPFGTAVITAGAVVSYTTISPFSRQLLSELSGCIFSVIHSVLPGYCPEDPRLTRGALPYGVRTFLPVPLAAGRSGCLTHHVLLLDKSPAFFKQILFSFGLNTPPLAAGSFIFVRFENPSLGGFSDRCLDSLMHQLRYFVPSSHA